MKRTFVLGYICNVYVIILFIIIYLNQFYGRETKGYSAKHTPYDPFLVEKPRLFSEAYALRPLPSGGTALYIDILLISRYVIHFRFHIAGSSPAQ